jgi:hypothetical protein
MLKRQKKIQKKIAKVFEYKQIACTRGRAAPQSLIRSTSLTPHPHPHPL